MFLARSFNPMISQEIINHVHKLAYGKTLDSKITGKPHKNTGFILKRILTYNANQFLIKIRHDLI